MLIAADYPFLDVFWTIIVFVAWVAWLMILFRVIGDIIRRQDTSGWGKAAWLLFVIVLPFLGVLVYLIANGDEMAKRELKSVADSSGPAAEIHKAKQLLDSGAINQAEFEAIKAKAVA
ncbi:MAG: hypothetical protein QOF06_1426 [Solirubrobacterales bacterium]|jgi:type VI protein secretion system component VasK|nr:hypothetical protein [Solirubrobacterales bacterium]MEA2330303.1 hypothetical protein [Thermoleophilaceae bacterium]